MYIYVYYIVYILRHEHEARDAWAMIKGVGSSEYIGL